MRAARLFIVAAVSAVALTGCLFGGAPSANVGDCLNVSHLGEEVTSLPTVDCSEPHETEVFATFDLDHSGPYFESTAYDNAIEQCEPHFADYVGTPHLDSEIVSEALIPTSEGWRQGDREIICLLFDVDWERLELTLIEGSLQGSGR